MAGQISLFWFRRDLRLEDNRGLLNALHAGLPVLPVFIFDLNIIDELPDDDARITFIHKQLSGINDRLQKRGSSLRVDRGDPLAVWKQYLNEYNIGAVFTNKDYEPYAIERDRKVEKLLQDHGIPLYRSKDQVIFEEDEIVKDNGRPYTVYTPYKRKWLEAYREQKQSPPDSDIPRGFLPVLFSFPSLAELGFKESAIQVKPYDLSRKSEYHIFRDFPAEDATTYLSPHLRFGTVSIRQVMTRLGPSDQILMEELIWREFFMQILFHFPHVVERNFNPGYDDIIWRNSEQEFEAWCRGQTGYPLVDAGMRQLNSTGYMHNRVRMNSASFLCKHLLVDWRWGEAYFAEKLLDFELASNNGNWQWAAGTGCDAVPYFRIFNPHVQLKRFDPNLEYVRRWVPEYGTRDYPDQVVDHHSARNRALAAYRKGIEQGAGSF